MGKIASQPIVTGGPLAGSGSWITAWAPPLLAVLIAIAILIPAEVWRSPSVDGFYVGIDPFLIYADPRGGSVSAGAVDVTPEKMRLVALPNSRPTVTLMTTPLRKVRIEMNVRIVESGPGTVPFRLGIWSPTTRSGYFVKFGPPPANSVTATLVKEGTAASTLLGGRESSPHLLGSYEVGVAYGLTAMMDKDAGVIRFRLDGGEAPPSGHRMLRIAGRGFPLYASQVVSDRVSVRGGGRYWFGGSFRHLAGEGTFGFVVEWIDRQGRRISTSEEWRHVGSVEPWARSMFQALAPPGAATARLLVGTSPGTEALFADLFLSPRADATASLLPNATFADGGRGWSSAASTPLPLEILNPGSRSQEVAVSSSDAPDLFDELRLAGTVNGSSDAGMSVAEITNYRISLPHQRWLVARVNDSRATIIIWALLVAALGMIALTVARAGVALQRGWQGTQGAEDRPGASLFRYAAAGFVTAGLYALLNIPLFNAGSLNYDLKSATVWLYTIPRYGLSQLYHLPTVVGPADAWGGVPIQEAAFPYGPVLADVFAAIAWLHKIFVGLPAPMPEDSFRLAFSVKLATLLFTLADALVIGLILRARGVSRQGSVIGAAAFLLNPAVIFVGSAWGQTQTISLFFLLLPLLADALRRPKAAWVTLALAALTRPQLLIAVVLIAVHLSVRYKVAHAVRGIAWGVIIAFLVSAPLTLTVGPSVPVDLGVNAFELHIGGENSPMSTPVSWGALSLWTLVSRWKDARAGLERLSLSSKEPLLGGWTYWSLGNILFAATLLLGCVSLLRRSREGGSGPRAGGGVSLEGGGVGTEGSGALFPAISLGTLALFVLKPSFAAFHLIPVLALIILWGEGYGRPLHVLSVLLLSATVFLPAYGMAAVWMSYHPFWNVGIFSSGQPITTAVVALFSSDWFLTLGSLANLAVLIILAARTVGRRRAIPPSSRRVGE